VKNLAEKRSSKMKKVMLLAFVMLFSVFVGCSLLIPSSNQTKFEYKADPTTVSIEKVGISKERTVLGFITVGDATIAKAVKVCRH
jgi:uncharacterized protein YpmS